MNVPRSENMDVGANDQSNGVINCFPTGNFQHLLIEMLALRSTEFFKSIPFPLK